MRNAIKDQFEMAHLTTYNSISCVERKVASKNKRFFLNEHAPQVNFGDQIKPKEIKRVLLNLKTKKSTGPDNINNNALKHLPNKAIVYLCKIFNGCLETGYFPLLWKSAKIIAIPKPGKDPTLPSSHKPISLLSCVGKIFEKLIEVRMRSYTDSNAIIPFYQFGFQPQLSTTHQLHRLRNNIIANRNQRKSTGMVLLQGVP